MPFASMENWNGMATYEQLQREPVSRELFYIRITTMQGLLNALKDSAFIAIDTEHIPIASEKDRILHQVGLAHVQTLAQDLPPTNTISSPGTSRPYLQDV